MVGPSGLDKRQATLHPCIRAAGAQLAPCWIIFRGKGNISQHERDFLNSLRNVRWAFQPRAWADGVYTLQWAEEFCDMLHNECPGEEHMLLLDELSSQMSNVIKNYLRSRGVLPVYIPGGCTDVLQPVDHHFGALLKKVSMRVYYVYVHTLSLTHTFTHTTRICSHYGHSFMFSYVCR